MSAWAKPGVKCVCINANFFDGDPCPLVERQTYTVMAVDLSESSRNVDGLRTPHVVVLLEEVRNPYRPDGKFDASRFRPLITSTQEQDLALFRHHLDGLPVGEAV